MLCKIKVTRNLHHAPRPGREFRNQPHVHVRECAVPILPRRSSGNRASLTQAQLGAGMTERATARCPDDTTRARPTITSTIPGTCANANDSPRNTQAQNVDRAAYRGSALVREGAWRLVVGERLEALASPLAGHAKLNADHSPRRSLPVRSESRRFDAALGRPTGSRRGPKFS